MNSQDWNKLQGNKTDYPIILHLLKQQPAPLISYGQNIVNLGLIAWFVKRNAYPEFWINNMGGDWWPLDAVQLKSIKWMRTLSKKMAWA